MRIPLFDRHGNVVAHSQVSRQDWKKATARRWVLSANGYAISSSRVRRKGQAVRLHRLVMGLPVNVRGGVIVDHINGDKLDNRRWNLRLSNKSLNAVNSGTPSNNTSGHRGVWRHRETGRWCAEVKKMGKKTYLGIFRTIEEAIASRRAAMKKLFGSFARKDSA